MLEFEVIELDVSFVLCSMKEAIIFFSETSLERSLPMRKTVFLAVFLLLISSAAQADSTNYESGSEFSNSGAMIVPMEHARAEDSKISTAPLGQELTEIPDNLAGLDLDQLGDLITTLENQLDDCEKRLQIAIDNLARLKRNAAMEEQPGFDPPAGYKMTKAIDSVAY